MSMKAISQALPSTFMDSILASEVIEACVSKSAEKRKWPRLLSLTVRLLLILGIIPLCLLSTVRGGTTFTQTNLVSDLPGTALTTDPNLVNPWGMTLGLNSGLWVSDNGAGKATTYDGNGHPIPSGSPTVVIIPAP